MDDLDEILDRLSDYREELASFTASQHIAPTPASPPSQPSINPALLGEKVARIKELESEVEKQRKEAEKLRKEVEDQKAVVLAKDKEVKRLMGELAKAKTSASTVEMGKKKLEEEIVTLKQELEAAKDQPQLMPQASSNFSEAKFRELASVKTEKMQLQFENERLVERIKALESGAAVPSSS